MSDKRPAGPLQAARPRPSKLNTCDTTNDTANIPDESALAALRGASSRGLALAVEALNRAAGQLRDRAAQKGGSRDIDDASEVIGEFHRLVEKELQERDEAARARWGGGGS
jgi:hypothetical protein